MDIVELLAELEELIEKGIEIPIIKKTFLDKEKLLDIINDISLSIPEEIREAKAINEDREKILSDAQRLADAKIKEAEHKVVSLIDEHEITRKATEKRLRKRQRKFALLRLSMPTICSQELSAM